MKTIKNQMYEILDNNQAEEQAGFRKDYLTVDYIFTVNKKQMQDLKLPFYFLILTHRYLGQILPNKGLLKKLIKILKNIYENTFIKT